MLFNFFCSVSSSFSSCCNFGGAFTSSRLGTRCWQKGTLKSVAKNIELPRKEKDHVIPVDVAKKIWLELRPLRPVANTGHLQRSRRLLLLLLTLLPSPKP